MFNIVLNVRETKNGVLTGMVIKRFVEDAEYCTVPNIGHLFALSSLYDVGQEVKQVLHIGPASGNKRHIVHLFFECDEMIIDQILNPRSIDVLFGDETEQWTAKVKED